MADISAIREGIAAALSVLQGVNVRPYWRDDPQSPALQVAGFELVDYVQSTGGINGATYNVIVEGMCDLAGGDEVQAQMQFDKWLATSGPESVLVALNGLDCEGGYKLTSRLNLQGQLTQDQEPAVDSFLLQEFRGYRRSRTASGVEALFGDFAIHVETSD